MLEPVQRALAGERGTVGTPGLELADQGREHGIVAQLVVVEQILVAQRDPGNPLHEHGLDRVFDQLLGAPVGEAARQASHQTDRPVRGPKQQCPGVRGHLSTIERGHHMAAFDGFISEQIAATLCRHRGAPLRRVNSLSQKNLSPIQSPDAPLGLRNAG